MSAITISGLSWALPEGRELFSNLTLGFQPERIGLVGRNGVGKTTLFRLISGELVPQAGKVLVDGRIGLLRQEVQIREDETVADLFGIHGELARLRRIESGDATEEDWESVDWSLEARLAAALDRMKLAVQPDTALDSLSGGQRTRAGLAALVFHEPDFILLDEPTNNLDREGRAAVIDMLARWNRGAIVISHDRELLEHMDAILELTSLGATRYGGNWGTYREIKDQELAAARHDLASAETAVARIARTAQQAVERKTRKDAGGQRKNAKDDTPRINLGRLKDRSEATSGSLNRLFDQRQQAARQAVSAARETIEKIEPITVKIAPTGLARGKQVLTLDRITAGYHPGKPIFSDLSLSIDGPERIAVTGPNGSGKSTLLAVIVGTLQPWKGSVGRGTEWAFLDQRVSALDPDITIRENFLRLHPQSDENGCRAALARFLFRADAALQRTGDLSGGQLLRAGLACTLGGPNPPPFLILDEPTNHLDIESIEAVEAGLSSYDGALLVVSHDEPFLKAIGVSRRIELPGIRPH
ncbi:MAG: ABC-F family ATP-binding cassette domain-containing protein [Luteolibacter sp.]